MRQLSRSFLPCIFAAVATAGCAPMTQAETTIKVDPKTTHGTWEGWGCSFAWWAHAVGGKNYESLYADLFFTDKTVNFLDKKLPGLHMNIIRYNVGGGGAGTNERGERIPDTIGDTSEVLSKEQPWHRDIDGYWTDWDEKKPGPNAPGWDWSRDANQRSMMKAAIARGVNEVEFFSNAPMWWMMDTKSSAGGNLQEWNNRDFALYLAGVTEHAQKVWGVKVDYLEPFNEPSAGWWNFPKNQEGANMSRAQQKEVLAMVREELDKRGLQAVKITASDENNMNQARETHDYFKAQDVSVNGQTRKAADLIEKVNVHSYNGLEPFRDNKARRALKESVGKTKLWANEFGNPDGSGIVLAQTIMEDLNHLHPTAWLYWQPLEPASAWGLVNGEFGKDANDPTTGKPKWVFWNYYAFAQFTRFLRPGMQVLADSDDNSVTAYDAKKRQLTIIAVNYKTAQPLTFDLSNLKNVGTKATVTQTVTDGSKLFQAQPIAVQNKKITLDAAPNSIHSIVIDGVDL